MLITETWLHDGIDTGLLDPEGMFHVLRKDRLHSRGGGVSVFVRRNINIAQVIFTDSYSILELVGFDLLCGKTKLRFFVIYRPPNCDDLAVKYVDLLIECLSVHATVAQTNIIVGDLNCPAIDWQSATSPSDCISRRLLDFTVDFGLYQFVDFGTRANNILDVLLADDEQVVTSVAAGAPIGDSDHLSVTFKIVLTPETICLASADLVTNRPTYKWRFADFDSLYQYFLCVDWQLIVHQNPSALAAWDAFVDVIYEAVELFIPKYTMTASTAKRSSSSYPRTLRKLTCKKASSGKSAEAAHRTPSYEDFIGIVLTNGGMKYVVWK